MFGRKTILAMMAVAIIGLVLATQAMSQPGQRGQGGDQQGQRGGQQGQRGQRGGFGGGQFDPAQFRQMMEDRLREQLGATEQEWKVLGPRVLKVQELGRQARGRGGMMFGRGGFGGPGGRGGRGGRGGPGGNAPAGAPARELTAVEKAQEQLSTVLENTASTPEQIKSALTTLRKEREAAKQQLAAAQQDLRKIITVRQEAVLVMMGDLD